MGYLRMLQNKFVGKLSRRLWGFRFLQGLACSSVICFVVCVPERQWRYHVARGVGVLRAWQNASLCQSLVSTSLLISV